jgi:hypothetical protein
VVGERDSKQSKWENRCFAYEMLSHSIDHLIKNRLAEMKKALGTAISAEDAEAIQILQERRKKVAKQS